MLGSLATAAKLTSNTNSAGAISGYNCAEDDLYKCYTPGSVGQVVTGVTRSACSTTTVTMTARRLTASSSLAEAQRVLLIQQRTDAGDDSSTGTGETSITTKTGTASSPPEKSSAGAASTDTSSGGSSDSTSTGDGPGGGLSKSGKIAIGVTIPVIALLAGLGILLFFLIRKKRRARNQMAQVPANQPLKDAPPMMPGPNGTAYDRAELMGTEGHTFTELQGNTAFASHNAYAAPGLDGQYARHELPPATIYERTAELPPNYRGG